MNNDDDDVENGEVSEQVTCVWDVGARSEFHDILSARWKWLIIL